MTLEEHLMMVASTDMCYVAIDYNNEQLYGNSTVKQRILSVRVTIVHRKILRDLTRSYFWINVQTILVKIFIKLTLICLSNSFFNSFMKMKNENEWWR